MIDATISTIILLIIIGVGTVVLLAQGFDIGDESDECADGYVPMVVNNVWRCVSNQDIGSAYTDPEQGNYYLNIENNINDDVKINISGIGSDDYHFVVRDGRHWVITEGYI